VGRRELRGRDRGARRRDRRVDPERGLGRDHVGDRDRAREVIAGHDLLDQPDPQRLGGVELVAGEQPPHRVAPAALAREPQRRAADRIDPALDLDLGEPRRRRRDPDVGREQELDADGQTRALDRADDRLADPRAGQAERIHAAVGDLPRAAREHRAPLRQIEPAGEVIAVGVQHADAQRGVALELAVPAAQRVPQRQVERVALRDPIEPEQQDVAAALDRNLSGRHRGILPAL
jgi:hypothetical protein